MKWCGAAPRERGFPESASMCKTVTATTRHLDKGGQPAESTTMAGGGNTVRSQSSEVAYLHSENRFLYDGGFFFFFLNSFFKTFFILKSEGEKKGL